MEPRILKQDLSKEFFTPERCYIFEASNSRGDEELSIARARVEPGVTTTIHYVDGMTERYLITEGKGLVEVGDIQPTEVSVGDVVIIPPGTRQRIKNTGDKDLIFYALCTPRFRVECYRSEEP